MSEPILDFDRANERAHAVATQYSIKHPGAHPRDIADIDADATRDDLQRQARRYAERRVAEAVARYAPLVQAVREWQEAYRADPLSDDAGIRYGKARQALLALPLPEAGK